MIFLRSLVMTTFVLGFSTFMPQPLQAADPGTVPAASVKTVTTLTKAQLEKIQRRNEQIGNDIEFDKQLAIFMGLRSSKSVDQVMVRQLIVKDDKHSFHVFLTLKDGNGYILGRHSIDGIAAVRLDRNLKLLAAVARLNNQNAVAIPAANAEKMLRDEFQLWARYADHLDL